MKMSNDLEAANGFDFTDGVEGEESKQRVIKGALLKFTNDAAWVTGDDDELDETLELVVLDIGRVVQKWVDEKPVETRVLTPDEKFPDVKALNKAAPQDEWRKVRTGNRLDRGRSSIWSTCWT
jgi:hypothetical protein